MKQINVILLIAVMMAFINVCSSMNSFKGTSQSESSSKSNKSRKRSRRHKGSSSNRDLHLYNSRSDSRIDSRITTGDKTTYDKALVEAPVSSTLASRDRVVAPTRDVENDIVVSLNLSPYEFENLITLKKDTLMVFIFAKDNCKAYERIKPTLEAFAETYDNVQFYYIDTDKNKLLCKYLSFTWYPTIRLYKNSEEVCETIGIADADALLTQAIINHN